MRRLPKFTYYKSILILSILINGFLLTLLFTELYHVHPESGIVYAGTFSSPVHIVNWTIAEKYYSEARHTIPLNEFKEKKFNYIAVGTVDKTYYLFGGSSSNNIQYVAEINTSQIAKPIIDSQHFFIPLPPDTFIKMTPVVKGNKLYFKVQTTRNFTRLLIKELAPIFTFVSVLLVAIKFFIVSLKKEIVKIENIDSGLMMASLLSIFAFLLSLFSRPLLPLTLFVFLIITTIIAWGLKSGIIIKDDSSSTL